MLWNEPVQAMVASSQAPSCAGGQDHENPADEIAAVDRIGNAGSGWCRRSPTGLVLGRGDGPLDLTQEVRFIDPVSAGEEAN